MRESYRRLTPTDGSYEGNEYPASVTTGIFNASFWYGDIDTVAPSRLHAFVARQVSVGGSSGLVGYLWAPYAPQGF